MHYFLLVTGNNVDKQMEPFWELDLSPEDRALDHRSQFIDETEELKQEYEKHKNEDWCSGFSFAQFCHEWNGSVACDPLLTFDGYDSARFGRYDNPNSKWDWYVVCDGDGRWDGLPLKDGSTAVSARKGDIDFSKLKSSYAVLHDGTWYDETNNEPRFWTKYLDISEKKRNAITANWRKNWKKITRSIPDNTMITAVDYHC